MIVAIDWGCGVVTRCSRLNTMIGWGWRWCYQLFSFGFGEGMTTFLDTAKVGWIDGLCRCRCRSSRSSIRSMVIFGSMVD